MSEETTTEQRGARKVLQGIVVSDKMDKTIVVLVEDRVKHPLYGKVMTKSSRLKAHDEENSAGIGDRVPSEGAGRGAVCARPVVFSPRWREGPGVRGRVGPSRSPRAGEWAAAQGRGSRSASRWAQGSAQGPRR